MKTEFLVNPAKVIFAQKHTCSITTLRKFILPRKQPLAHYKWLISEPRMLLPVLSPQALKVIVVKRHEISTTTIAAATANPVFISCYGHN